jgi:tRNA A37 threonylcarbamoyladenosine biosynthesis protein TsaE
VAHCDLYRLTRESVEDLGLDEYSDSGWVLLVEWPDRRSDWGGEDILEVSLAYVPEGVDSSNDDDPEPPTTRIAELSAQGRRARELLRVLIRGEETRGEVTS